MTAGPWDHISHYLGVLQEYTDKDEVMGDATLILIEEIAGELQHTQGTVRDLEKRLNSIEQPQQPTPPPPTTDAMQHLRALVEWWERSGATLDAESTLLWVDAADFVRGGEPTAEQSSTVQPRSQVRAFAVAMEEALRRNDHKGGWRCCELSWLYDRMIEEFEELRSAYLSPEKDPADVLREAADVANFAMMFADRLRLVREPNRVVSAPAGPPLTRDEAERIVREVTGDPHAFVEECVDVYEARCMASVTWRNTRHALEAKTKPEALQALVDAVRAVCASGRGR